MSARSVSVQGTSRRPASLPWLVAHVVQKHIMLLFVGAMENLTRVKPPSKASPRIPVQLYAIPSQKTPQKLMGAVTVPLRNFLKQSTTSLRCSVWQMLRFSKLARICQLIASILVLALWILRSKTTLPRSYVFLTTAVVTIGYWRVWLRRWELLSYLLGKGLLELWWDARGKDYLYMSFKWNRLMETTYPFKPSELMI